MRDLYKLVGISSQASDAEIHSAIATAPSSATDTASAVLLNTHRRPVYDRNHRLLTTIGHLRSRLGLTLTPFWARSNSADFADAPPAPAIEPSVGDVAPTLHATDSMMITRAFVPGRHRSHRARSLRNREILLAAAGGVLSLALLGAVMYLIKMAS